MIENDGTNETTTNCTEWPNLQPLQKAYAVAHPFTVLPVCTFGILTNILNATILTQSDMRNPTNAILTAVAIMDCVTMLTYVPETIYFSWITPVPERYPQTPTMVHIVLLKQVFGIGSHTVSTGLLVQLAAFRCWILYTLTCRLSRTQQSLRDGCRIEQQWKLTYIGFSVNAIVGLIIGLPSLFLYKVKHMGEEKILNSTENNYWLILRDGAHKLEAAHFTLYGCFVKILASVLIFVFTLLILVTMRISHKRSIELQKIEPSRYSIPAKMVMSHRTDPESFDNQKRDDENNDPDRLSLDATDNYLSQSPTETNPTYVEQRRRNKRYQTTRLMNKTRQSQRATIMLIVLMVGFVATEAPQGVANTLITIYGECFHDRVYSSLGDLLDLLVLLNSSVNFVLYCAMSQKFRQKFTQLIDTRGCCSLGCFLRNRFHRNI